MTAALGGLSPRKEPVLSTSVSLASYFRPATFVRLMLCGALCSPLAARAAEPSDAAVPALQVPSEQTAVPPAIVPANAGRIADAQENEDELSLDEWERDDWTVARPRVALFDVSGYLRLRGDMARNLTFGTDAKWEQIRGIATSRYPAAANERARYNHVSTRLRLEPRLHISDAVQIMSTIDVLDNMVFGSSADTLPGNLALERPAPNVLSRGQVPQRRGINAFNDTIVVKRLWTRVGFLHDQLELKVGRMPDHWGLGMWANSGDCLNCDGGTVVDRLSLSFRALGHVMMPHVDWVSRGPLRQVFGLNDMTPIAAAPWADTMAYGLRISKEEHPDDIRDALAHGRTMVTYGLSNALRRQAKDIPRSAYTAANDAQIAPIAADLRPERRDALIYQGDAYAKMYRSKLELGAEVALQAGNFYDTIEDADNPGQGERRTRVLQLGVAAEALYHVRDDRRGTRLGFKLGGASGDPHPGMGARELADSQRGAQSGRFDRSLTAFQFNPDYHLDLLLFRRLLGTVTDAWYARPEIAYRFDDKLSGRLAAIYSQALNGESTPSGSLAGQTGHTPLGIELNGEMAYGVISREERGQLLASLAGGLLFPLNGMLSKRNEGSSIERGRPAWTLQARMFVTF